MPGLLNYPGSSSYGIGPTGLYGSMNTGTTPAAGGSDPLDYGVFDPSSGRVISIKTGRPWHGREPRTGQTYNNGVVDQPPPGQQFIPGTTKAIDPNDPNQRYKPVDIVKSPDVASATTDLMAQFKKGAGDALKGFDEYLTQFKTDLAGARTKAAAATDAGPTIAALTQAQRGYTGALDASTKEYQDALKSGAAAERGIIGQEQATLPMYNTALSNIEDKQLGEVMGNLSRYKLGTGTPTSLGSTETGILAREAANVALPIEMAKINKQYDIYGQALPVERDITGRNISYAGSYLPGVAGSEYSSATGLANTIQSLKAQVANMSYQQALQFLQAQGVPPQLLSQVLGGESANLNQILGLETGSRYSGLQDVLGTNLSQPQYYSQANPPYPAPNRGGPPQYPNDPNRLTAPDAPVTVGGGTGPGNNPQADRAYYLQTGRWPQNDPNFSQAAYDSILNQLGGQGYPTGPNYADASLDPGSELTTGTG